MQIPAGEEVGIFENQQRAISKLKKEDGEEKVKTLIRALVSNCFAFYDKHPGEIAIDVIYETIISQYFYFKMDDIKLCLARGMASKYGKVDFFHAGVITEWLAIYDENRLQVGGDHSRNKHQMHKEQEGGKVWSDMPEETRQNLIELGKRLEQAPARKMKYKTLQHYFRDRYSECGDETAKEIWVNGELGKLIEGWQRDFESKSIEPVLDFPDYVEYRSRQELMRINEE